MLGMLAITICRRVALYSLLVRLLELNWFPTVLVCEPAPQCWAYSDLAVVFANGHCCAHFLLLRCTLFCGCRELIWNRLHGMCWRNNFHSVHVCFVCAGWLWCWKYSFPNFTDQQVSSSHEVFSRVIKQPLRKNRKAAYFLSQPCVERPDVTEKLYESSNNCVLSLEVFGLKIQTYMSRSKAFSYRL